MKEPKEKHLIFILECLKGKHLELIKPKEALSKLFDRFFNNLKSISLMIKALSILHRALQEEDISQMVAHRIKEKENMLYPCQKEDQSFGESYPFLLIHPLDGQMQGFICDLYIDYIKNLINFIIICQLFSISLKDLHHYTKNLQYKELFLIFSRIDGLIENILKIFEQKEYSQHYRLLHSVYYLLFMDLLKIYQSYYILVSVMLEKFEEMQLKDAKRAFIIYLNLVRVNKEIRKMASCILKEFNMNLDIYFYEVDTKMIESMKQTIEVKERSSARREEGDSGSSAGPDSASKNMNKELLATTFQLIDTNGGNNFFELQGQGKQKVTKSPTLKFSHRMNEEEDTQNSSMPPRQIYNQYKATRTMTTKKPPRPQGNIIQLQPIQGNTINEDLEYIRDSSLSLELNEQNDQMPGCNKQIVEDNKDDDELYKSVFLDDEPRGDNQYYQQYSKNQWQDQEQNKEENYDDFKSFYE